MKGGRGERRRPRTSRPGHPAVDLVEKGQEKPAAEQLLLDLAVDLAALQRPRLEPPFFEQGVELVGGEVGAQPAAARVEKAEGQLVGIVRGGGGAQEKQVEIGAVAARRRIQLLPLER